MKHKELQAACDLLTAQIKKNNEKKEAGQGRWFFGLFGTITEEAVIKRNFFTNAMQTAKTKLERLITQEDKGSEIDIKEVKTIINDLNTTLLTEEIVIGEKSINISISAHQSWKPIHEALLKLSSMREIIDMNDFERRSKLEQDGIQLKTLSTQ